MDFLWGFKVIIVESVDFFRLSPNLNQIYNNLDVPILLVPS